MTVTDDPDDWRGVDWRSTLRQTDTSFVCICGATFTWGADCPGCGRTTADRLTVRRSDPEAAPPDREVD